MYRLAPSGSGREGRAATASSVGDVPAGGSGISAEGAGTGDNCTTATGRTTGRAIAGRAVAATEPKTSATDATKRPIHTWTGATSGPGPASRRSQSSTA